MNLALAIERVINDRRNKVRRISVKYLKGECISKTLTYRNRTHIMFFDKAMTHDLLALDYAQGVAGEQAFDPSERPF